MNVEPDWWYGFEADSDSSNDWLKEKKLFANLSASAFIGIDKWKLKSKKETGEITIQTCYECWCVSTRGRSENIPSRGGHVNK